MALSKNKKSELIKSGYRITKEDGKLALRVRVPGGNLTSKEMNMISEIAEKFGRGDVHITSRQGFEVPGIPVESVKEVNKELAPILKEWQKRTGVKLDYYDRGYPATGTRNIMACIGSQVCSYGNFDVEKMTYEIERTVFPSDYHVKIGISGCLNDCIKGYVQDFGIMGQVKPIYKQENCKEKCRICVDNCLFRSKGALTKDGNNLDINREKCNGCGECIMVCPHSAWENGGSYYKVLIMGRTGKKDPRMAFPFLSWITKENLFKIIENLYEYIDKNIDKSLPKESLGYIYDRTGHSLFRDEVLKNVELNEMALEHNINIKDIQSDEGVFNY